MKYLITISFILLFFFENGASQSFTSQNLNKEPFYSNVVLMQDYDGDGDLDIICTSTGSTFGSIPVGVYWLENEPTHQFKRRPIVTDNIKRIRDLDMADFDSDGKIDYLVCMRATPGIQTDGELAWFQRQADGTYVKWTIDTGADFDMAVVTDFNNDGKPDIVATGFYNKSLSIYINQGNLFFTKRVLPFAIDQSQQVNVGDMDNDGDQDIVFSSNNSSPAIGGHILWNQGNATFQLGPELNCYNDTYHDCGALDGKLAIADINGDGKKDILSYAGIGTGGFFWLSGANNFDQKLIENVSTDIYGDILVFDINGDGKKDIVKSENLRNAAGDERIVVLYQTGDMVFQKEVIEHFWDHNTDGYGQMAYGDLDNDGDLDLVVPENGNVDGDISWFENINGKFYRHYIYNQAVGVIAAKFVDIDKDNDMDVLVTLSKKVSQENEIMLYENIGNNNFVNWRLQDSINYPTDIEPADIDGDGDLDVFVTSKDGTDLMWLRNDGKKGNWEKILIDENINESYGIKAVDLDKDGKIDVIACSFNDNKLFWYKNNGGSFSKNVIDANVIAPYHVKTGDLDGDGDIDISIVCKSTTNTVVNYINNGNQSFTKQIKFTGKLGGDIEIADWNKDNKLDIIFSINNSSPTTPQYEVVALINQGNNTFRTDTLVVQAEKGSSLKVADLDKDGNLDLIIGRTDAQRCIAWLQKPNGLSKLIISNTNKSLSNTVLSVDVADANGDGINDVLFTDFTQDEIVLITFKTFVSTTTQNIAEELQVSLFPNPANDKIQITSKSDNFTEGVLELTNVLGQVVKRQVVAKQSGFSIEMDVLNVPKGVYLLQFSGTQGILFSTKIIKN